MPRNKDLKRLVRARMNKTGEAYTAARAQITKRAPAKPVAPAEAKAVAPVVAAVPAPGEMAVLAGTSNPTIKEKTGCTWERWVAALDGHGADKMSHTDIARLVHTKYKIDGWWSQAVTVGYERIKGLRERGQRRDGSYEATKSRTFNVPVTTLFDAWVDAKVRRRWMDRAAVKVRTATAPKTIRLDWPEGGIIVVGFTDKGKQKSVVDVTHTKLPDKDTATRFKEYWTERLGALGEVLAKG